MLYTNSRYILYPKIIKIWLTNTPYEDWVCQEQAVVHLGEFELVACEPVGHLRLTFIPNETGISQVPVRRNLETCGIYSLVCLDPDHNIIYR